MTAIGLTRMIFNNTLILYVIHFYQNFCLFASLYLLKCSTNSLKELQGKKLNGKKY